MSQLSWKITFEKIYVCRKWIVPKTLFVFVIHKHLFVFCVCVALFSTPKSILRADTNLTRDWKKSYIGCRTWIQQKIIGYFFIFFSGELKIYHIPPPPTPDFDAIDTLNPSKGKR